MPNEHIMIQNMRARAVVKKQKIDNFSSELKKEYTDLQLKYHIPLGIAVVLAIVAIILLIISYNDGWTGIKIGALSIGIGCVITIIITVTNYMKVSDFEFNHGLDYNSLTEKHF